MRWSDLWLPVLAFGAATATLAQTPDYGHVGRAPSQDETAQEGAKIYASKCAACHGPALQGSPLGPRLMGGEGTFNTLYPVRTIGSYWPFATTIWDYINRAMPRNQEGSLGAGEVYALTAFLLYKNKIIQESDVIDARSLPRVKMPNRDGFVPQRLEDIHDLRKRGCRLGYCP
jgi:hypothetical protein